jgi:hypothetical protein
MWLSGAGVLGLVFGGDGRRKRRYFGLPALLLGLALLQAGCGASGGSKATTTTLTSNSALTTGTFTVTITGTSGAIQRSTTATVVIR